MFDEALKVGDVVELKSGGPSMTIDKIENHNAWCTWFVGTERKSGGFAPETLRKVSEEQLRAT